MSSHSQANRPGHDGSFSSPGTSRAALPDYGWLCFLSGEKGEGLVDEPAVSTIKFKGLKPLKLEEV